MSSLSGCVQTTSGQSTPACPTEAGLGGQDKVGLPTISKEGGERLKEEEDDPQ